MLNTGDCGKQQLTQTETTPADYNMISLGQILPCRVFKFGEERYQMCEGYFNRPY